MEAEGHLLGIVLTRRDVLAAGTGAALAVTVPASAETAKPPAPRTAPPGAPSRSGPRIDIVCRDCGGNSVARDAWAEWDVETQDWVLGPVFDQGFCYDCDREARLDEAETVAGTDP
ncbi:MAG: hypothetical protein QOJ94_1131 [Sphingomonadales bacterium]|nr:hypothetical protein [Sphingomonadales bacterium]